MKAVRHTQTLPSLSMAKTNGTRPSGIGLIKEDRTPSFRLVTSDPIGNCILYKKTSHSYFPLFYEMEALLISLLWLKYELWSCLSMFKGMGMEKNERFIWYEM